MSTDEEQAKNQEGSREAGPFPRQQPSIRNRNPPLVPGRLARRKPLVLQGVRVEMPGHGGDEGYRYPQDAKQDAACAWRVQQRRRRKREAVLASNRLDCLLRCGQARSGLLPISL